jgi:hypothetical protein
MVGFVNLANGYVARYQAINSEKHKNTKGTFIHTLAFMQEL